MTLMHTNQRPSPKGVAGFAGLKPERHTHDSVFIVAVGTGGKVPALKTTPKQQAPLLPRILGWALIVMLAAIFCGCATPQSTPATQPPGDQNEPTPKAQTESQNQVQGPTVVRLEEQGGRGFIIEEIPQMDAEALSAFDQAVMSIRDKNFDRAIELLEPVVAKSPRVTAPYINLALGYEAVGQKDKAKIQLQKALELIPDHPAACNLLGLLCRKSGDFDQARIFYEKAIASFPGYYPVHRNLGILYDLYLNDPASALKHYELYSVARPGDEAVKVWIADLQNRLGEN